MADAFAFIKIERLENENSEDYENLKIPQVVDTEVNISKTEGCSKNVEKIDQFAIANSIKSEDYKCYPEYYIPKKEEFELNEDDIKEEKFTIKNELDDINNQSE